MAAFVDSLNPRLLDETLHVEFRETFRRALPFSYLVIPHFLTTAAAHNLARALASETFFEKESDLFCFHQTHDLHFAQTKTLKAFHRACLSWDFFSFISSVTGVALSGTLDMSGTCYKQYNYLLCHDDQVEKRRIAYILYLTPHFTARDGGSLELYTHTTTGDAQSVAVRITPRFNTLVLFSVSAQSFHAVSENRSKKHRYALSGWLA